MGELPHMLRPLIVQCGLLSSMRKSDALVTLEQESRGSTLRCGAAAPNSARVSEPVWTCKQHEWQEVSRLVNGRLDRSRSLESSKLRLANILMRGFAEQVR